MMNQDKQDREEAHLQESRDEREYIFLDDSCNAVSLSDDLHLLQSVPESDDPPLSSLESLSSRSDQIFISPLSSFIELPSYAEAVTSESSLTGVGKPELSSALNPSSSDYMHIEVTDPKKEQESTNSLVPGGVYYSYLIKTRTNLPEYGGAGSEFSVRRRFNDVVNLSESLSKSNPGYFIPMRPDKNMLENQDKPGFLEQRTLALEKYLLKLAAHPVLKKSEEVRVFLTVRGKLPKVKSRDMASRMLGEQVEALDLNEAQPAKGGRDFFGIFKELSDWVGKKPLAVEEDKEFLRRKEKLMKLEQQLINVSQQAKSLVECQQHISETMGKLGLAFEKLYKFEEEEANFSSQSIRAADMRNVGTAAVESSRLLEQLNTETIRHLETLHDYREAMLAINNAFSDRSEALLKVQKFASQISSLKSQIEKLEISSSKLFSGNKSRARKLEEMKEAIKTLENKYICAKKVYEQIKENNRSELERIDQERRYDSISMIRGFVANQASYAQKMAAVWKNLAEETAQYS